MFHIQAIHKKSMANCVKYRFSINLQLFSVVLISAPLKYITTYCPWDSHQMHSSCTSMSLWWQNNPILWLSWAVSIPNSVSILWHAACAPTDAKLLEGGVYSSHTWLGMLDCICATTAHVYQVISADLDCAWDYLSKLGLKLIHVSKSSPRGTSGSFAYTSIS